MDKEKFLQWLSEHEDDQKELYLLHDAKTNPRTKSFHDGQLTFIKKIRAAFKLGEFEQKESTP